MAVYFDDILKTMKIRPSGYFSGIKSDVNNYEFRQSIRLSLRYTFGNKNITSKQIIKGNEEEREG